MGLFGSKKYKDLTQQEPQQPQYQPTQPAIQLPQQPIPQQIPQQQNIYVEKLVKFKNMLLGYVLELEREIDKYG